MEKIGEIVELNGKSAVVRVYKASSCEENCSHCNSVCKPTTTMIEAYNGISAQVGDTVKLNMNTVGFFLLSFVGYMLPVVICVTTYLLADKITGNTLISDISAVFSLVAVLIIFFLLDKLHRRFTRFSNRILKILK